MLAKSTHCRRSHAARPRQWCRGPHHRHGGSAGRHWCAGGRLRARLAVQRPHVLCPDRATEALIPLRHDRLARSRTQSWERRRLRHGDLVRGCRRDHRRSRGGTGPLCRAVDGRFRRYPAGSAPARADLVPEPARHQCRARGSRQGLAVSKARLDLPVGWYEAARGQGQAADVRARVPRRPCVPGSRR